MLLQLVTAPAQEPLTLPEVKAHLRVLHDTEDDVIARYARAARIHIEATTGRAFVTQVWDFWLSAFPRGWRIELPRPPLQTVTWVKYREPDGVEQTLDAAAYLVVTAGLIGRVELAPGAIWPATQRRDQAVNIRFVAGYGTTLDETQEDLRTAILLMTEHLYYNRGATTAENLKATPMSVDALLGPYRTFGWGPSHLLNEMETSSP
jgi:uncharacterized phiE125 gp8 family phage protein